MIANDRGEEIGIIGGGMSGLMSAVRPPEQLPYLVKPS